MSKQDQEAVQSVLEALEANAVRAKGAQLRVSRVYTRHVPTLADLAGVSLPPQARVIVRALLTADTDTWTEPEMHELVCSLKDELATKQDPWKIWKYYFRKLESAGFVESTDS